MWKFFLILQLMLCFNLRRGKSGIMWKKHHMVQYTNESLLLFIFPWNGKTLYCITTLDRICIRKTKKSASNTRMRVLKLWKQPLLFTNLHYSPIYIITASIINLSTCHLDHLKILVWGIIYLCLNTSIGSIIFAERSEVPF